MKVGNLASHDPEYPGAGLPQSSRRDAEIWVEFGSNPEERRSAAQEIMGAISGSSNTPTHD
jgi:hypothetical protein